MAWWAPDNKQSPRYVFVWTRKDGKAQKLTPRKLYKHLDAFLPDKTQWHNIQTWVDQWSLQNEGVKVTPDHILFSDSKLNRDIESFLVYLQGRERKLADGTVDKYRRCLRSYAIPYFLSHALKDPHQWPSISPGLLAYLQEKKTAKGEPITSGYISDINNALRKFFTWMEEERIVQLAPKLLLRNPPADEDADETPLDYTIDPKEVFSFVEFAPRWEVRFMALVGYFFSLRPQEVFELKRGDFWAGSAASHKDCAKAMLGNGLYPHFAVNIQRQRTKKNKVTPPKAHSKGFVSCFHEQAAQEIIKIISQFKPEERILAMHPDSLYKLWSRSTKNTDLKDTTLKDLRRASVYHLGHNTGFSATPILLMKHARHREFETTQLYLRRPAEESEMNCGELELPPSA